MKVLIHLLISAAAIFVAAYLLPGVEVMGAETYFILAIVLGVINTFIKPILTILTLPLTIITLGLFSVVLNAGLILLAAEVVPGFSVEGFFSAVLFGLVLGLVSSFLKLFD